MIRILWIIGFSIALHAFSGITVVCLIALITLRHLNGKGWTMFVVSAYGVYFMFGRLRASIRYGDPTKDLNVK
jgi:hypothetical protein